MIDALPLAQGDRVGMECTHYDDTADTVTLGDSSTDEMCQVSIYRYPANASTLLCLE